MSKYTETHNANAAAELSRFESSQVLVIKEVVPKENVDCDFQLTRAVDVSLDQAHVDKAEIAFNKLVDNGAESVAAVNYTGKKSAEQVPVSISQERLLWFLLIVVLRFLA